MGSDAAPSLKPQSDLLRVLILEDDHHDGELLTRELRRAGLSFTSRQVAEQSGFLGELQTFQPDVILADYNLPGFGGVEALNLAREHCPEVPFIFVSGAMGEELAIESLKMGATDYVLKGRLDRLPSVITRALKEAAEVAERRRAEEARRKSEEDFRLLVKNLPGVVFKGFADGSVTFWDDKIEQLSGFKAAFFTTKGWKWLDLILPEDLPHVRQVFLQALKGDRHYIREYRIRDRQGRIIPIQERSCIILDEAGRIEYVIGVLFDITERRRAELALKEQFLFLQTLLDTIPNPIFYKDAQGIYLGCNKAFEKFTGLTLEELKGKTVFEVYPKEQAEVYYAKDNELFAQPGVQVYETTLKYADGSLHDVIFNKATFFKSDGTLGGLVGVALDITERKRMEKATREAEQKLRNLMDHVAVGVSLISPKMEILELNKQMLDWFPHIDPAAKPLCYQAFNDPLRDGVCDYCPTVKTLQDGKVHENITNTPHAGGVRYFHIVSTPLKDAEGNVLAAIEMVQDITERRRWEEELRRVHAQISQLFESIPSILISIDPQGRVLHCNAAAQRILKVSAAEIVGRELGDCGIPWDWPKVAEAIARCREKKSAIRVDDVHFYPQADKEGLLGLTVCPMTGKSGELEGLIILGSDITKRRLLEAQLAQAQKLEGIGQLAAGIAHEINTPIQFVGDNLRFLQQAFTELLSVLGGGRVQVAGGEVAFPPGTVCPVAPAAGDLEFLVTEIPQAIDQALEGVARVAAIVRAMKEFSHPGVGEKVPVDVNKAIENAVTVSRNAWKYVADLVTDLDPQLPLVPCLPGEFNQVLLNLIINAAQAIAETVAQGKQERGLITVTSRAGRDWVEIRVSDTGGGIPATIRHKVFEPFFSTKEVGKGTGQGLAICHNVVVEKHKGSIMFESEEGKGTTFIVRLPLA